MVWPEIWGPEGRRLSRTHAWEQRELLIDPSDAMANELRQTDSWKRFISVGIVMWPITACSWAGREERSWGERGRDGRCDGRLGWVGRAMRETLNGLKGVDLDEGDWKGIWRGSGNGMQVVAMYPAVVDGGGGKMIPLVVLEGED
jgi:hypothetical protein